LQETGIFKRQRQHACKHICTWTCFDMLVIFPKATIQADVFSLMCDSSGMNSPLAKMVTSLTKH